MRGIEAGVARHVPGQHRIDRIGDAGLERDRLLCRCRLPCDDESEDGDADARGTTISGGLHRRFLRFFVAVVIRRRNASVQNSRNSRPNPSMRSLTPQRRSASQTIA
jgi:hypothetical protein